ncbi:SET domain-containing protein [Auriscalpium vulgare]|uniref:SET domain-containing protein n=1 Tax=Auriscalpium vulgare TaxID=40419 RepID=A0ACB8RWB7_9AGAM|nr:SET domain-containing protein [Auriscalpium vulgare]
MEEELLVTVVDRAVASKDQDAFHDVVINGLRIISLTPRRILHELPPKVYYAKDLPHALQDSMNRLDRDHRNSEMARSVFEAFIFENTCEDEPEAPRIHIINDIDDEATPAWEFHYSNQLWHGENVPPPDLTNLLGCGCRGHCDPRSKTCLCLKRQQEYSGEVSGFIYDDRGRLKEEGYPIFECNDLCGCLEDCRNRVVQRGRKHMVNIRKTKDKGWGVFAGSKKIPKGSFIGIYAGELLTDSEGDERGIKYNKFGRTYLFDLDFYYLQQGGPKAQVPSGSQPAEEWEPKFVVDAYHAGNFTRFLNHSCDPNCSMNACYINEANLEKPLLTLFTTRDVLPYEEVTFSYSGAPDDEDEPVVKDRDAVYAACKCGAPNCRGQMFR